MAQKFKPAKSVEKQYQIYLKEFEKTGIKLPEYEELRPFIGKRGRVLKSKTRSKKAQKAYKEAEKHVMQLHGNRAGAKAINAAMKQKQKKDKIKLTRGEETRAENEAKKELGQIKPAKAEKSEKKEPDKTPEKAPEEEPKKTAPEEEKPAQPMSMVEAAKQAVKEAEAALAAARANLDYAEMVEEFNKGAEIGLSAKVIYEIRKTMEAQGFSQEDINKFINKILASANDVPEEARALYAEDDFGNVILQMIEFNEAEQADFSKMVGAYIMADLEDQETVTDAIRYWQENGQDTMSFGQFWEELNEYNDWTDPENWEEILEG